MKEWIGNVEKAIENKTFALHYLDKCEQVITDLITEIKKSEAVREAAKKEKEQIIQIIKQQRWHFSDVEWENLLNRIQALAAKGKT